ncbi:MAG: 1-(5-phosphoribosyl)-5-[(5-phosphoribosylamino)methylideneamino]imidazole-4-carboxamide isomerase [Candidatus Rokubacteria bacterium RIFCSPLOWO2_02_FULL_68_19]|nr:MAG: 1-(5-phosphoribosyl)-5-[(5-phosphoribosylamino)methylideneamino]imidazole-4-carboxamide isomerase [Candidatus Rokubacteria bacterium RIFCSPLOWO2_02_FULL_68_19]OGL15683.1 MAG: 1-(5-phosphoribosyl)-5-[(5-phosphoribosylamino)methylideneamino]imidazole-4-carboxamide isomerase [Candidatus Rokubacteria bacterium RIFCSPLOWO2_12_FULL_69_21]
MMVIPAVDLRGGRCVRLRQGRPEAETVFSDDPLAVARAWAQQGAPRLHVVDLDGAFAGTPKQLGLIEEIARGIPVPVEAGGGLRSLEAVETLLASGARWAMLGTRAALDPSFLEEACRRFAGRIIVAVDASDGRVAVDGWTQRLDIPAVDLARRAAQAGAAEILYTDIARDGTETGPNLSSTAAVAAAAGLPLLASGGVGSLEDLRRLAGIPGVIGAVVGRALYTGAVDLKQALVELAGC